MIALSDGMDSSPTHQPGQLTPDAPRARPPSSIGRVVVIALLVLGAALGCVTVWYWTTQVKLADTEQAAPTGDAGEAQTP